MDKILELEVEKALKIIEKGGVILYPTDTIWGIGCDALNSKAIEKIYKIKNRNESKGLIILLSDINDLQKYVSNPPTITYDLIDSFNKPVTIIFDNAQNLPKNLISKDGTIAIRIAKNPFCKLLIDKLKKPITSTSANVSTEESPLSFSKISNEIIKNVDYSVQLYHNDINQLKASTIIRLQSSGYFEIIRE